MEAKGPHNGWLYTHVSIMYHYFLLDALSLSDKKNIREPIIFLVARYVIGPRQLVASNVDMASGVMNLYSVLGLVNSVET